ncbi:MAG: diaminopimelate epimerase [Treponemataceae bacterium]
MKPVPFTKMSGLGNDFIVVDNRSGILNEYGVLEFAQKVCKARYSVGGDELMVIDSPTAGGDYTMRTINPDGNEVKMCGNASRCVARYAFVHGIAGEHQMIDTLGGKVEAFVGKDEIRVGLQVTSGPVRDIKLEAEGKKYTVHTAEISGAPQAVIYFENAFEAPGDLIHKLGAAFRYHPYFPKGTNVNFIELKNRNLILQRTYERGVEGETYACGTGATASAVVSGFLGLADSPVTVRVLGGDLTVSFERQGAEFSRVFLGGGARFVAEGTIHPEGWEY